MKVFDCKELKKNILETKTSARILLKAWVNEKMNKKNKTTENYENILDWYNNANGNQNIIISTVSIQFSN